MEGPRSLNNVERSELGDAPEGDTCIAVGERLFVTTPQEARDQYYDLLRTHIKKHIDDVGTMMELGCGYGYNLWRLSRTFPGKHWCGGEFSQNIG